MAANADSIEAEEVVSDDVVSSSSAVAAAAYAPTSGQISSVSADSTLADVRVMQMQHEIQLAKMNANMVLQAARFEETMKRVELQSRFELQQAQSRLDSQAAVATAQLKAAEQMKDHMQAAEAANLQAMADRLAIPREQRAITSGALVRCPIDKGKDEMHEWSMALAAAASGLCEVASDIVMKVMARDATVLAFAAEPDNVQSDRWLARQINTSVKEDTEAGKLFHKEARQDAAMCRSGVRLLDKVYKTVTKSNPLKLDMRHGRRRGMETMRVLTASDIHVIEHDRHRQAQTAKRKPTNVTRDPKERIFTPGTRFVIDVKTYAGKDQVTQIADRTGVKAPTSCIMAIDDSDSNYVYSFNSDTHTTEVLINFLSHVVMGEKMLGHEVKVFKFDRAPEIDCEVLKRRVESELHERVLIGPSGEHECVARAEALMDI
eukprot:jgi/Chrpa1/23624/Chrysochromulina_OHIO_Genome00026303-RA